MSIQFIHDNKGNTTGVFIPIEQWQELKNKYSDLHSEESDNDFELTDWQKKIIDERLTSYYENPDDVHSFEEVISKLKKSL